MFDEISVASKVIGKNIFPIGEYHHGNSKEFDVHGIGVEAWSSGQGAFSDEVEDRIRFFAEESDFLKGFQLINDGNDGFGGISSKISEHIQV